MHRLGDKLDFEEAEKGRLAALFRKKPLPGRRFEQMQAEAEIAQFVYGPEGLRVERHPVDALVRPPLRQVPEYALEG